MPHNTRYPSTLSSSAGRSHYSCSSSSYYDTNPFLDTTSTIQHYDVPDFRFCIELGLILRSRTLDHKTSTSLERELGRILHSQNIPSSVASPALPTTPSYAVRETASSREWTITAESSIPSQPRDHRFGIKLTSPFMVFAEDKHDSWMNKIQRLYDTLMVDFEVTSSHQCFTHIHIVPKPGYWTYLQLESLAKAALYFEGCLDEIVPPYRRKSVWAKSNRLNAFFSSARSTEECFDRINAGVIGDFVGLARKMNWCSAFSATGQALGKQSDFVTDTYRWSFAGLAVEGRAGSATVGYNQPPASTTAEEAIGWVTVVCTFARLACVHNLKICPEVQPLTKSLGEWLVYEAGWCLLPNVEPLKDLLRRATPAVSSKNKGVDAITIDEDERLWGKQLERDIVMEKYRRMLLHIH